MTGPESDELTILVAPVWAGELAVELSLLDGVEVQIRAPGHAAEPVEEHPLYMLGPAELAHVVVTFGPTAAALTSIGKTLYDLYASWTKSHSVSEAEAQRPRIVINGNVIVMLTGVSSPEELAQQLETALAAQRPQSP